MSLLPYGWDDFPIPSFDFDFQPSRLIRRISSPWRNFFGKGDIGSSRDEFRVNLDVQQFKPEELKVRVDNGFVNIEGEHEERPDQHGFISRKFIRRYEIPEDIDIEALQSNLSSDGVLTLRAPKKGAAGRTIPINYVNAPAIRARN